MKNRGILQGILGFEWSVLCSDVAPPAGLEPATTRLTAECSAIELRRNIRLRNCYVPQSVLETGGDLLSRAVSSQVPSALKGLTSVFGMGTGDPLRHCHRKARKVGLLRTFTTAHNKERAGLFFLQPVGLSLKIKPSAY